MEAKHTAEEEKEIFNKYNIARDSGQFNMIMDANKAMAYCGLNKEEYWFAIDHYSELYEKYGE